MTAAPNIDGLRAEAPGMETTTEQRANWAKTLDSWERPDPVVCVMRASAQALLRDCDRLSAALAEDKLFLEERIQERLDEINAEGDAFDKDSANALRFILQHYCGDAGKDTLDHPDGWNTQDAIDCVAEVIRAATAREAAARAEERERAAKIAGSFANTRPNLDKSDNPTIARIIATVMSDTGQKIESAIRSQP